MRRAAVRALSVALASLLSACQPADRSGDRGGEGGRRAAPPPDEIAPPEYGPPPTPDEGEPPTAPVAEVTLYGQVVEAGTNAPLEAIQVTFGAARTTTDAEGRFTILLDHLMQPGERHPLTAADMDGEDHGGDHHPGSVRVEATAEGRPPATPEDGWRIRLRKR
ncbi:MAG: hypothetical protein ABIO70_06655 [Pseudomonadota bacterium]